MCGSHCYHLASRGGRGRRLYRGGAAASFAARCLVLCGDDRTGAARFLVILLQGFWCPVLPFLALPGAEAEVEASGDLESLLVRCRVSGVTNLGRSDCGGGVGDTEGSKGPPSYCWLSLQRLGEDEPCSPGDDVAACGFAPSEGI